MTDYAKHILTAVLGGTSIANAIKSAGISANDYYRELPEGERTVISIARKKYVVDNCKKRNDTNKREYRISTSILPKQTKVDFTVLALAKGRTPSELLAMYVIKAVQEAKGQPG